MTIAVVNLVAPIVCQSGILIVPSQALMKYILLLCEMYVTVKYMEWVAFSYSLSTKSSSPRVALWRRLRRLGAISPAGGLHVLPARDECIEAFNWLAQEIRLAHGEAVVLRVQRFEGLTDQDLIALFNRARDGEYAELETQITSLTKAKPKETTPLREAVEKLRKQHADIARVDYFGSPAGARVAARLATLAQSISSDRTSPALIPPVSISAYRGKTWVTRPRPYVDRLACAWLIRRFIDPHAVIRYSGQPEPGQSAFDMEEGGEFGHRGNLCTFETMCRAFGLDDARLSAVSEIVHEIDLRDGQFIRPAATGVDAVLEGWHKAGLTDAELETHGIALFEGLYQHFVHSPTAPAGAPHIRKGKGDQP